MMYPLAESEVGLRQTVFRHTIAQISSTAKRFCKHFPVRVFPPSDHQWAAGDSPPQPPRWGPVHQLVPHHVTHRLHLCFSKGGNSLRNGCAS